MDGQGSRRKAPKKSETLQIRIPHTTKEEFLEACEADGANASEVLRRSILDYLSGRKRQDKTVRRPRQNLALPSFLRRHRILVASGALTALGLAAVLPSAAAPDFRAAFDRLDKNGDGRLTTDEYFEASPWSIKADAVIYRADKEEAVFVDYPDSDPGKEDKGIEILNSEAALPGAAQRAARRLPKDLDPNGDGLVDFREYEAEHLRSLHARFDMMDRNKDGRLDFEELTVKPIDLTGARNGAVVTADGEVRLGLPPPSKPGEKSPAAHADANKDGVVTLEEYLADRK